GCRGPPPRQPPAEVHEEAARRGGHAVALLHSLLEPGHREPVGLGLAVHDHDARLLALADALPGAGDVQPAPHRLFPALRRDAIGGVACRAHELGGGGGGGAAATPVPGCLISSRRAPRPPASPRAAVPGARATPGAAAVGRATTL